jgi:peptidoglycan LD-endopeptidase CwlK
MTEPRKISKRTKENLAETDLHPDLVKLISAAYVYPPLPFEVTDGLRTLEEQKQYFSTGKSKTMKSRHLRGGPLNVSRAFDFVVLGEDGKAIWTLPEYRRVAAHIKAHAKKLNIPITWGGDWKGFIDGPHIELDVSVYP